MKNIGAVHSSARPEVGERGTVLIGIAWAPGAGGKNSSPKTVIRAGFGVFTIVSRYRTPRPRRVTTTSFSGGSWLRIHR